MQALVEQSHEPDAPYRVVMVLSDKADAPGLQVARDLGIDARAIPAAKPAARTEETRTAYDRLLAAAIDSCDPALIVLAGYMRILSAEFVTRYAGRILNIHPSLLPKYPGLHTHQQALAARDVQHGATVHFVTAELDGGPPIIQARVPVTRDDDESTLAARVMTQEHRIYPLAVRWYCEGRLRYHDEQAWLDGQPLLQPVLYAPSIARPTTAREGKC
jgi:phosphoribosylglycinamide formyltransferase 1